MIDCSSLIKKEKVNKYPSQTGKGVLLSLGVEVYKIISGIKKIYLSKGLKDTPLHKSFQARD